MHNSHFILVNAENEGQAEMLITSSLDNFGNENNYWRIKDIYNIKTQKEETNNLLEYLYRATSKEAFEKVTNYIEQLQQQLSSGNKFIYWQLSQEYRRLYEILCANITEPLTSNNIVGVNGYYDGVYDEFGFTNMVYSDNENTNTFLIEIDMHS